MPPATPLNYVPWVFICYIFSYFIRRRYFGWWFKYNCEYLFRRFEKAPRFFLTHVCIRCSVCRFGRGLCHRSHPHLLCSAIPQERHDRPELCSDVVGQHCLYQNGRLYGRAIQVDCRRRNLWPVQLVKVFFHQVIFRSFCIRYKVMLCWLAGDGLVI